MTFTDKIFDRIVTACINLEYFDSNSGLPPNSLINNAIATLRDLFAQLQFFKWYFHRTIKFPSLSNNFLTDVHIHIEFTCAILMTCLFNHLNSSCG